MRVKRVRLMLWSATIVLAGASCAVVIFGLNAGNRLGDIHVDTEPTTAPMSNPSFTRLPPLAELEILSALDLRRPLYDAPPAPPPPAVAAQPPPPLPFKLAGTVIEPGRCRALLLMSDGKLQFTRVGDNSAGAEILEIGRDSVTLRYFGQDMVLKLEKKDPNTGS